MCKIIFGELITMEAEFWGKRFYMIDILKNKQIFSLIY